MKKRVSGFVFVVVVMLVLGVIISAENLSLDEDSSLVDSVFVVSDKVGIDVKKYVEKFVSKRGIDSKKIKNISKVDFNKLPKEVNIENVDDTNLAIYEVDYEKEDLTDDKVFMITYSVEELKAQGDLIVAHDKRQFLDFGFSGEITSSEFLMTSAGVMTSLEKGYVMVREGSINAISSNLEVVSLSDGLVQIVIYKNGEEVNFRNSIDSSSLGVKKDYDIQSKDVVTFVPGDIISSKVIIDNGAQIKDVITMVEITTVN